MCCCDMHLLVFSDDSPPPTARAVLALNAAAVIANIKLQTRQKQNRNTPAETQTSPAGSLHKHWSFVLFGFFSYSPQLQMHWCFVWFYLDVSEYCSAYSDIENLTFLTGWSPFLFMTIPLCTWQGKEIIYWAQTWTPASKCGINGNAKGELDRDRRLTFFWEQIHTDMIRKSARSDAPVWNWMLIDRMHIISYLHVFNRWWRDWRWWTKPN